MKSFLQEYGMAIFQVILIIFLIVMASPLSVPIKTAMSDSITTFNEVVMGDSVNDGGYIGNIDDAMDKAMNIEKETNKKTEDGDINAGNDTDGKDTGLPGDLELN